MGLNIFLLGNLYISRCFRFFMEEYELSREGLRGLYGHLERVIDPGDLEFLKLKFLDRVGTRSLTEEEKKKAMEIARRVRYNSGR